MIKTRGRKIIGDILARKGRTLLVVLAIMIGVFGVTTLTSLSDLIISQLERDLDPAHIGMTHVYVGAPRGRITQEQNAEYLNILEQLPGIEYVQGEAVYGVRFKSVDAPEDEDYIFANILAWTEPFGAVELEGISRVIEGRYPENGQHEIAVDRRFSLKHDLGIGDRLVFLQPGEQTGPQTEWEIVGVVFHPYFTFSPAADGGIDPADSIFASYEDAQQIGSFPGLTVFATRYGSVEEAEAEEDHLREVIAAETPYIVGGSFIDNPDDNTLLMNVRQVANVLNILSVVSMIVSGFLVVNIINTIVLEQKRQIGVMKSVGATRWDNFYIYAGIALVYGVIGTIFGVLLALPVAASMAQSLASLAFTLIEDFRISTQGIMIGVLMGLLVPVLAAAIPVFNGTRISIMDAMTDLGISSDWGKSRLSRLIGTLPLPVTIRQALSNVAQKRGRLTLTGFTLTLAVGVFMGVTAVFTSLNNTIESVFARYNFEITMSPREGQDFETVRQLVTANFPSVDGVYPGYNHRVDLPVIQTSDQTSTADADDTFSVSTIGIDTAADVIDFDLIEGIGWQNDPSRVGFLISAGLADYYTLRVGDMLNMGVNGQSRDFELIGIHNFPDAEIILPWQELARMSGYVDEQGNPVPQTYYISLAGEPSIEQVDDVINAMRRVMTENGILALFGNQPANADAQVQQFNLFSMIFNITSGVMAAVGAIGLLATLSMAVFERQKEIGVMRSIGANSTTIVVQFLIEGILVGVIAWVIAIPISVVLGQALSGQLGFGDDVNFVYPPIVILYGCVGMMVVAAIASIWPSLAAARKTVSDILRYQ